MSKAEHKLVASLCEQLPELRRAAAAQSSAAQRLLVKIEGRALAGRSVAKLVAELDQQLKLTIDRGSGPLPGVRPNPPSRERFGCPGEKCDREVTPYPAGPIPRCWLSGDHLRLKN